MRKCVSCNKVVSSDYTEFKCPKCLKGTIIRCDTCKNSNRGYKCEECGFIGP